MVSICNLEIQKLTAKLIWMKHFKGKYLLPLMVRQRGLPFFARKHTGCWIFLRNTANNSSPCITATVNTSWALLSSFLENIYLLPVMGLWIRLTTHQVHSFHSKHKFMQSFQMYRHLVLLDDTRHSLSNVNLHTSIHRLPCLIHPIAPCIIA